MNIPYEYAPMIGHWYNYRTGEYEPRDSVPENMVDYVPQSAEAQKIYSLLTEQMGRTPLQAALHVLMVAVGETPEEVTT